jgi:hypothetical protein
VCRHVPVCQQQHLQQLMLGEAREINMCRIHRLDQQLAKLQANGWNSQLELEPAFLVAACPFLQLHKQLWDNTPTSERAVKHAALRTAH